MPFVRVASVHDLTPGVGKLVQPGGKKIALFCVDGNYYAIDDACPHRNAPLHEGTCEGATVICPYHVAKFDLATGKHLCPPAKSDVRAYAVRINGEDIEIEV